MESLAHLLGSAHDASGDPLHRRENRGGRRERLHHRRRPAVPHAAARQDGHAAARPQPRTGELHAPYDDHTVMRFKAAFCDTTLLPMKSGI